MTTSANRLSPDEENELGRRLRACLDLAAKRLYGIICSDREVLSDPSKADSPEFLEAADRLKRYAAGELSDGRLRRHLHTLTRSVDHGFRILRSYGPPDGGAIADRFVEANQGLVGMIARQYEPAELLSSEELMQIGQFGLLLATLRFDPMKGKFSSFAVWWIRHFINRGMADIGRLIRLPVATVRQARDIEKAQRQFWQKHGQPPRLDELAKAAQCSLPRLLEIMPHLQRPGSLDAPNKDSEGVGATPHETMPADALSAEAALNERQTSFVLEAHLARLSPMEQDLIVCQLDLCDGMNHVSLDQLGLRYHYSREGVRQVYLRAMDKLRTWIGQDLGLE